MKTHQVHCDVELLNEALAPLLGLLKFGKCFAVGPPPQPGGEGPQADVVAGSALVEALYRLLLQPCHEEVKGKEQVGITETWSCALRR